MKATDNTEEISRLRDKVIEMEKLASLGLLNAGIMHEIQNPMNFILNFSKMSGELIGELSDWVESVKTKLSEDDVEELVDINSLLVQNIEKIEEHGKRVDTIIKGILGFSRKESDKKSPVKINELISMYTGFAYHAMRVKATGFNVKIEESFDSTIGQVLAYSGDLSRAILNITNNAFFAVRERAISESNYAPCLKLTTKNEGDKVRIEIQDNGTGIPKEVKAKMYEPFFTTKEEGKGTGLGLFMTREIIEEQHNGKLEVESEPNEFTRFIITIPIK